METSKYPVDVICYSSADGKLRPLRMRTDGDNRIDIQEIIKTTDISHVGMEATIFLCRGICAGQQCLFELKYYLRTHTWWLLRKIL